MIKFCSCLTVFLVIFINVSLCHADDYPKTIFPICQSGKYGFIDINGTIVIQPTYDDVAVLGKERFFKNQHMYRTMIYNKNDGKIVRMMGLVDFSGIVVCDPKYDTIEPFYDKHAAVMRNDKWGVIDDNGKEVIKPIYDAVSKRRGNYV